jgi:phenylacetate-CoA ligase
MFLKKIKNLANNLPAPLGLCLSYIDYKFRLGPKYSHYKNAAAKSEIDFFPALIAIVKHAQENVPFYSEFYRVKGFHYSMLKSVDDIKLIPIVQKSDLQAYPLSKRCAPNLNGILSNTGGTTGQPLDFKLDNGSFAREWAHMHTIWETLGYEASSLKLTLRGKNLGNEPIKYFFNQNEFQINAYCDFEEVLIALEKILSKYKIQYVHGYPSAIYDFMSNLADVNTPLLQKLKTNLKGVFLGSEYPAPHYRSAIEQILSVPTMSWYGHSEMAVLAYEKYEKYVYVPFASYGLAEAVEIDGRQHLVATSFDNYVCPLIRYDTGDLIEPVKITRGILEAFKISEGRLGEFIVDGRGRHISLTALIFGRHHDIFGYAKFVQIYQPNEGKIDVFVVTDLQVSEVESKFDFSNVDIEVCFYKRLSPMKTKLGKVPLLLKDFYETSNPNS